MSAAGETGFQTTRRPSTASSPENTADFVGGSQTHRAREETRNCPARRGASLTYYHANLAHPGWSGFRCQTAMRQAHFCPRSGCSGDAFCRSSWAVRWGSFPWVWAPACSRTWKNFVNHRTASYKLSTNLHSDALVERVQAVLVQLKDCQFCQPLNTVWQIL